MDLLFIVGAPSSLHLKDAELIDVALVRVERTTGRVGKKSVQAAFTTRIQPVGEVTEDARKLSEYSEADWTDGFGFNVALKQLKANVLDGFHDRYTVIAYRSELLRPILRNECARLGASEEVFAGRAWIDIGQLAWPLVDGGLVPSRDLETLAAYFGVALPSARNVADMCSAMVSVYAEMMRRYRTALTGEQALREVGGETLEGIRRIIGF